MITNNTKNIIWQLKDITRGKSTNQLNTIITALCVCLTACFDMEIIEEKLTASNFEKKAKAHLKRCNKDEELQEAFKLLCKYIVDDDVLNLLYYKLTIEDKRSRKEYQEIIENLITIEFVNLEPESGTPVFFNNLCIALLQPSMGTFYDGTAGIASTAIKAHLYAQTNSGEVTCDIQEINVLYCAIATIRKYTLKIEKLNIYCGDTLTSPYTKKDNITLNKYDYSIMFPPLGMSWKNSIWEIEGDQFERFSMGLPSTASADWLFVQHQITSLTETGKGIIALPTGALFNAHGSQVRKKIIQLGLIECIITLPAGLLPYTATPISLLIINKNRKENSSVQMILTDTLFKDIPFSRKNFIMEQDKDITLKIVQMYEQKENIAGVSQFISHKLLEENDWILLPSRYVYTKKLETEHGTVIIEPQKAENWLKLKDIGYFYRGITVSSFANLKENGKFEIINYADIHDGEIRSESLGRYNLEEGVKVQKYLVKPNDMIISCKGSAIKIALIPEHTGDILLSNNFIGLRINLENFDAQFIEYYLKSPVGQLLIQKKQVGTTITTLNIRDLGEIEIPQLSLEEQKIYTEKLIQTEKEIQEKMNYLHTQASQAKWEFYQEIGLGKIMRKEN